MKKDAYSIMLTLNRALNRAQFKREYSNIRLHVEKFNALHNDN